MRDIIQRHNRLNGLAFSVIEFGLIALLVGTFATYYVFHHRVILAVISWGISVNCLPVVVYGIRSLRDNQAKGRRIGSFWSKQTREQRKAENPHMLRDTLILTAATLLPFVSLVAVLFDVFASCKK